MGYTASPFSNLDFGWSRSGPKSIRQDGSGIMTGRTLRHVPIFGPELRVSCHGQSLMTSKALCQSQACPVWTGCLVTLTWRHRTSSADCTHNKASTKPMSMKTGCCSTVTLGLQRLSLDLIMRGKCCHWCSRLGWSHCWLFEDTGITRRMPMTGAFSWPLIGPCLQLLLRVANFTLTHMALVWPTLIALVPGRQEFPWYNAQT